MNLFKRYISWILLLCITTSHLEGGLFADEEIHGIEELPSFYLEGRKISASQNEPIEQTSIMSLIRERSDYDVENNKSIFGDTITATLDAPDMDTEKFSIQKSTKIRNTLKGLEKNNIETTLRSETEIHAKDKSLINPSTIGIHAVSDINKEKAKKKIMEKMKKPKRGASNESGSLDPITFEFGIEGEHLLFSKPVAITIDTPQIMDGIIVDIFVLHAGDMDYNTSGLTNDTTALCNSDGTTTKTANTAIVRGGKVTFYTCGASSFTINPTGGVTGSNDLKLIVGDCGQFQLYYNGAVNIYGSVLTPPATGCIGTLDSWIALRIGATTYGSDWTAWTTQSTTGSQSGNTYSGTTTLMRTVGGRNYNLILNWQYTAPNKYFTIDWTVIVPTGNANNIRFYIGNDSMVGGNDTNDVGYSGSTPTRTVGVYDNVLNQMSAIRYLSGLTWTAQEAGPFGTIQTRINGGIDFANTVQTTTGDLGFGVNWNFGITPGTYTGKLEWRVVPFTTANVPDVISGIGQPTPALQVGQTSTLPITVTNVGNASSTGVHTVLLGLPANISGPSSAFVNNGWSCGAQVGTGVTCTKNTTLISLSNDTVTIPVIPGLGASGATLRFTALISNAGETNTTNNSSYVDLQVTVAPPPPDAIAPTITATNIASGSLVPGGKFIFSFSYFDTGSNINTTTATGQIYSWNTGSSIWNGTNLAPLYMTLSGVTTSTGTFQINNLPFGKYRFDMTIRDNNGNTTNGSITVFVDSIEWTISSPIYDIGGQQTNISGFGSGELLITIKTVGAGFDLSMLRSTDLTLGTGTISVWNGTEGWGYELYNGVSYSGSLTAHGTSQSLANVIKNINQSGQKNTYIYRVKYGMKTNVNQTIGDYIGKLQFTVDLNY